MTYYLSKTLEQPLPAAIAAVEAALGKEGFGVLTRIDIAETLKTKIGADVRPYVILGACNPKLAFEALQLENKVGTMLPCNVVIQEVTPGRSEVAAIDPVESMRAIKNAGLSEAAAKVREKLNRVIEAL